MSFCSGVQRLAKKVGVAAWAIFAAGIAVSEDRAAAPMSAPFKGQITFEIIWDEGRVMGPRVTGPMSELANESHRALAEKLDAEHDRTTPRVTTFSLNAENQLISYEFDGRKVRLLSLSGRYYKSLNGHPATEVSLGAFPPHPEYTTTITKTKETRTIVGFKCIKYTVTKRLTAAARVGAGMVITDTVWATADLSPDWKIFGALDFGGDMPEVLSGIDGIPLEIVAGSMTLRATKAKAMEFPKNFFSLEMADSK